MLRKTTLFLLSVVLAVLAAGSLVLFGDTLRLLAEWRVDPMDSIFLLHAGLLAALIFWYRAKEARYSGPISIIHAGEEGK